MSKLFYFIPILIIGMSILSCKTSTQNSPSKDYNEDNTPISNNYILNATGQVDAYNNEGQRIDDINPGHPFFGQDANYLKGKKMSFKKNDDGTITDLNTGLVWQSIPSTEGYDWEGAVKYCENLKLAGHKDWRIPSLKELFSISNFNSGWPYLDTKYFSLVNNKFVNKNEQYWSSNQYVGHVEVGGNNAAFGVNHATGHIKAYPASAPKGDMKLPKNLPPPPPGQEGANRNGNRPRGNPMLKQVRAVRGTTYGINDFQDNENGTITDKATGLMWAKNDSGKELDWQNALMFSEISELAGYTDWRLPNVKELQSIVNYSYSPNATNSTITKPAINTIFNCTSIVNENGDDDYGYYWTSTSARFQKGQPYYYAWYVAFGRAVNAEGKDSHGAGAVRFDTKVEEGPLGEGGERFYNFVRMVRSE